MLGSTYYENEAKSEMNPWCTARKGITRYTKVIKDQTYWILIRLIILNYSSINNIQFRLSFEGHKSLEYCCLEMNFASISKIFYGDLNGGIFAWKIRRSKKQSVKK
jgi:hypothetical protein